MKKTSLCAVFLFIFGGFNASAIEFGDIEAQYPLYSVSDPFAIAVATNAYNKAMAETALRTAAIISATNATTIAYLAAISDEATERINGDSANNVAIQAVAANVAFQSNRINTANVNIANNSNRINTANANIANVSNTVAALSLNSISAPTGTNIAEAVVGQYTNSIATAWQNPPSATNWTWISDGHEITLTGYNFISMDVVIPDMLDGLPVTKFNDIFSAGGLGTPITSITGGYNILSIGGSYFENCTSLVTVDLPYVKSLGTYAFQQCTSIKSLTFNNVKTVNNYAFIGCTGLTNVWLLSAESFGEQCFAYCYSLKSVYFSKNAPSAGTGTFDYIPDNQVTNYAINPTATGWGATFGGMPVVRMPVTADSVTLGGVTRTTWPDGGGVTEATVTNIVASVTTNRPTFAQTTNIVQSLSGSSSTPLAWTPIETVASASVATARVTTAKSVYSFTTATAIGYTNDLSQLALNCGTNYEWEAWINYTDTNALATTWEPRIDWQTDTPDLTVTGLYKFAFSTACGTKIIGKQIYPTVYRWMSQPMSATLSSVAAAYGGSYLIYGNTITNGYFLSPHYNENKSALYKLSFSTSSAVPNTNTCWVTWQTGTYPAGFSTIGSNMAGNIMTGDPGLKYTVYAIIPPIVPDATAGAHVRFDITRAKTLGAGAIIIAQPYARHLNELETAIGTNRLGWASAYRF